MSLPDEAPRRCFVGLLPDPQAAARLDALAQALQREYPHARRVPRPNLHLTLAFIGDLPVEPALQVAARLRLIVVETFTWTVDAVGSFAGPRVAWAGGAAPPLLQSLVDAVQAQLRDQRIPFDRRPFVPHVTLMRHLPRAVPGLPRPIDPPIAWTVRAPVLLQSTDGRYAEIAAD
jgi:RNA 2',3'-cyclic 3'-phosphodiesterase